MEIYVGNLPWSVRDQELAEAFGPYGSVEKASVITYRDSGRSKGFGFVTMNDDDEANKAIEAMNGPSTIPLARLDLSKKVHCSPPALAARMVTCIGSVPPVGEVATPT